MIAVESPKIAELAAPFFGPIIADNVVPSSDADPFNLVSTITPLGWVKSITTQ